MAHIALGVVLCEVKRDYDGAIACCRQAIELDPKIAEAHSNLGEALKNKGQWDEVIAQYKKARELNPNLVGIQSKLAFALIKKGRWDEAIASLRQAIEFDPKDGKAYNNLGGILCDVKRDYDGAIACFRKAIALNPKDAMARATWAMRCVAGARLTRASHATTRPSPSTPSSPWPTPAWAWR